MKEIQFNNNTSNGNNKCYNISAGRITDRLLAILVTTDDIEHEGWLQKKGEKRDKGDVVKFSHSFLLYMLKSKYGRQSRSSCSNTSAHRGIMPLEHAISHELVSK